MLASRSEVRFRAHTGKLLLGLSLTGFVQDRSTTPTARGPSPPVADAEIGVKTVHGDPQPVGRGQPGKRTSGLR